MRKARYLLAHVIDFIHANILQHWPYWTCNWVVELWPDEDHDCRFCRWAWPKHEED